MKGTTNMAAKWQQWMPLHIDRFMGSPSVRAMHPAAQMGYLYLLMVQWQSEDCTVSSDPFDLAEKSGLGDELWAVHGPRILRKFEAVESSARLRNKICFEEWERARGTYQKRADAAEKTNTVRSPLRSPSGNGTVTVPETTDKRTGTVYGPVSVSVDVGVPVNGDSGSELILASWIFEEMNIPTDNATRRLVADAIRLLVKRDGGTTKNAADFILQAAKAAEAEGDTINRFWFSDRRYNPQVEKRSKIPKHGKAPPPEVRGEEENHAKQMWESMSDAYKEANPWTGM